MTTGLVSGDLVSDRYASALYDLASEKKIVDLENIWSETKRNKTSNLI